MNLEVNKKLVKFKIIPTYPTNILVNLERIYKRTTQHQVTSPHMFLEVRSYITQDHPKGFWEVRSSEKEGAETAIQ